MMEADRLLRALSRPGVFIDRDNGEYVVRGHPDRRRKPLLRLADAELAALLKTRRLKLRPDGAYVMTGAQTGVASAAVDIADSWQTDERGRNIRRRVNSAESPMAWLMRHKDAAGVSFLDRSHLAALECLRDDHLAGYAQPGLTSNWDALGGGGRGAANGDGPHVFRLAERRRCQAALACLDDNLRAIFERVCLEGTALGVIERGFGLPRRSAKHHIRAALDRLAKHYGY